MATRTRNTTERKPNFQPNHLPSALAVVVRLFGALLGPSEDESGIDAPQGKNLSENGNVTFNGGIREGWCLPGTWMETLKGLSFTVNGHELKMAASGVHTSEKGNPTVCHTAIVELPSANGGVERYTVQVYATFSVKKGSYNLSVKAFPASTGSGVAGPQVVGEVKGLTVEPRAA